MQYIRFKDEKTALGMVSSFVEGKGPIDVTCFGRRTEPHHVLCALPQQNLKDLESRGVKYTKLTEKEMLEQLGGSGRAAYRKWMRRQATS